MVAIIRSSKGKLIESSVANLLPYRGGEQLILPSLVKKDNRAWYDKVEGIGPSEFSSSSDSDVSISNDDADMAG